jgi:hypothetical protein
MAAKASRIHTLLLLVALGVSALTATVTVAPVALAGSSSGPVSNGDPDRPNDSPKPAAQQQSSSTTKLVAKSSIVSPVTGSARWSWAMEFIATLLGRHGL